MKAMHPYLNFNGQTEEAFNFYRNVFGGEFSMIQRFSDVPAEFVQTAKGEEHYILHVSLPLANGTILMGSDVPGYLPPVIRGTHMHINLEPETREEADRIFQGLSEGGQVMMPLADAFWGAYYGMLTDQFGVAWMINLPLN